MNFKHSLRRGCSLWLSLVALLWAACDSSEPGLEADNAQSLCSPDWVQDAVFYQIFPERFRNGDLNNDPVRTSIADAERAPDSWQIMPWTAEWYARSGWERAMGEEFYSSVFHRRYGGDLQGVLEKLDYLQDLGITAVYFNPLFHARSLHKYDGTSFHHIDPYFGPDPEGDLALIAREVGDDPKTWQWTAADSLFLELIDQMHARGMRVVIDGVFNHTGRDFFAFADLAANQTASRFGDWYKVTAWDNPATEQDEFDYEGWWGYKPLPEFADSEDGLTLAPGPAAYVNAITRRWMDPDGDGDPSDGVDGWRLDVATDVPTGFWRVWHQDVCSLNPAAYTVAEIWDEPDELKIGGGFVGVMNYFRFAYPVTGFLIDGTLAPTALADRMDASTERTAHLNLVDSHDTDRLASMIVNGAPAEYERLDRFDFDHASGPRNNPAYSLQKPYNRERHIQRLVVLLQMTWTGAPMVYYGSESGMWGADDPDNRMPMVWDDLVHEEQTRDPLGESLPVVSVSFDSSLYAYYSQAATLRHRHPALRRGTVQIAAAVDTDMIWAFERAYEDERLIVAINRGERESGVQMPPVDPGVSLRVVFVSRDEEVAVEQDSVIILPPLTGVVLKAMRDGQ